MYPQPRTSDQVAFLRETKASDASGEIVEPWLEELQALDFVEGKPISGPIGESSDSSQPALDVANHVNSFASCESCCPTIAFKFS